MIFDVLVPALLMLSPVVILALPALESREGAHPGVAPGRSTRRRPSAVRTVAFGVAGALSAVTGTVTGAIRPSAPDPPGP